MSRTISALAHNSYICFLCINKVTQLVVSKWNTYNNGQKEHIKKFAENYLSSYINVVDRTA